MAEQTRPEVRVERATDMRRYLASDKLVWFDSLADTDPPEVQMRGVPEDQRFAAEVVGSEVDPATYAAIYGVRPMQLSVPDGSGTGRPVPVAGLTWVGVHPDHRRRGLLTAMLRHHFAQTRHEGGYLSALHASEPGIYGRHGYGLASLELEIEMSRGTAFTAPDIEDDAGAITTRLATISDPGIAERRRRIDLDLMSANVGTIVGAAEFYAELCRVTAEETRDSEPDRILIAVHDGRDVGYAVFKRKHKWPNGRPAAEVSVHQLSGGPVARLALLRRLADLDLSGTVTVSTVAVGDPVLSWVQGPRGLGGVKPFDSLWLRIVDLPEAWAARGYEADCDVVVEVTDGAAPWNGGRWRVRAEDGTGEATRTDGDAELSLAVAHLAAAYLGAGNLVEQHRAGLIREHRPGAVRELWHSLRTDVAPHPARGF
jgi:ribosomal protein S18 acetylase RimI-like enzyme